MDEVFSITFKIAGKKAEGSTLFKFIMIVIIEFFCRYKFHYNTIWLAIRCLRTYPMIFKFFSRIVYQTLARISYPKSVYISGNVI